MIAYQHKYGVVYVAVNLGGDEVAKKSLNSLRAHSQDIHATLFTDQSATRGDFDDIIRIDSRDPDPVLRKLPQYPEQGIFAKARMIPRAPYEYCIFSDYDIHFCGDISDIFRALEEGGFDFISVYDQGEVSLSCLYPDVPFPIVKFHLGLLAWHNSPKMQMMFSMWRELLIDKCSQGIAGGAIDEWTFSYAAYLSKDIRWGILPANYCCRFIFPYIVRGEVKALHGRSEQYGYLVEAINSTSELRVGQDDKLIGKYVPGVGFMRL